MVKVVRVLSLVFLAIGLVVFATACAPAAPTPTATPKPAVAAGTPTKAAPTPTPQLIRWEGDKLQPMPDGFPNRTITLWSGFKAGHNSDIYLRMVAEVAKKYSPVAVVVENRVTGPRLYWELLDFFGTQPGGTEGYALAEASFGASALRSLTVDIGAYTHKDINPVIMTEQANFGMAIRVDDTRFKTVQELIKWAKDNPGKLKIGSSSFGSQVHLTAVLLAKQAGFDFVFLPHSGGSEALLTLMGGGVDAAVSAVKEQIARPELKVVMQTGEKRSSVLPDVPLPDDLGYKIPLYAEEGLWTHSKVSKERVTWLYELFKKVAESPEYQKRAKDLGANVVIKQPEEVRKLIDDAAQRLDPVVRELGLHKEQQKEKPKS